MRGFGGLVTFLVKDADWRKTADVVDAAKIFRIAPSLGGVESLIEQPLVMSYYECTPEERVTFGIYDMIQARVWPDGDGDQYMAEVIIREILEPGHRALIYSGCNHAYTRYHQPVYDFDNDTLIRLVTGRMGNRVYDRYGDRCFNIFLHSPWPSSEGHSRSVLPADGLIDSLIAHLPDSLQRAGFDVARTPFAELPGESGFWKYGYPEFSLADYCDGYIIQGPMTGYRGVSVAEGFINEQNRIAAILQSANPDPRVKDTTRSVADLVESLASDTKIQAIFARDVIGYDRLKR